jgi:hypothetical protein
MSNRESLHTRWRNPASGTASHAVRAGRCPLLYLQIWEFPGEASIFAVLRLKALNLLLAFLPVQLCFPWRVGDLQIK